MCHILKKNRKHWVYWLCGFPCFPVQLVCPTALYLSKPDSSMDNYHLIVSWLFGTFLIFSILFKAIFLCVCSLIVSLTYIFHCYILTINMWPFLKENASIEKTRTFILLPFVSLKALSVVLGTGQILSNYFLNRIKSLKIGWGTISFADNMGVSVKKTV